MGNVFEALADPSRRKMLSMLAAHDMTAGEIAGGFEMTKPSVSHHLSVLKHAGLIEARRSGQSIVYSIDTTVLEDTIAGFMDLIRAGEPARAKEGQSDR